MTLNLFNQTMQSVDSHLIVSELAGEYRRDINHHVFRGLDLSPLQLSKMFQNLNERYQRNTRRSPVLSWLQEEKKLYQCFLLVYCHLNFKKIIEITQTEWTGISALFGGKNALLLKYQAKILEKSQERVRWTVYEEDLLGDCTRGSRELKWAQISRYLFFHSHGNHFKTPKQCRQHWNNHMNGEITHGAWSIEEDLIILELVLQEGRKWARIALQLQNRRTQHMIKNRFHSLLTCAKHLLKHKPQYRNSQAQMICYFQKVLSSKRQKTHLDQISGNFRSKQNINYIEDQQNQEEKCLVKEEQKDLPLKVEDKQDISKDSLNTPHEIMIPEVKKNSAQKNVEIRLQNTTFTKFYTNNTSERGVGVNFPFSNNDGLFPFMNMSLVGLPFPSQPFPIFHPL